MRPRAHRQSHAMHKTFTQAEVDAFLVITGDANPLHSDKNGAAAAAGFGGPILPGVLLTSMFPAIIGSTFPGAVYASQNVSYRAPALIGQPVVAQVRLKLKREGGGARGVRACGLCAGACVSVVGGHRVGSGAEHARLA
jgi:acyl dehydratase